MLLTVRLTGVAGFRESVAVSWSVVSAEANCALPKVTTPVVSELAAEVPLLRSLCVSVSVTVAAPAVNAVPSSVRLTVGAGLTAEPRVTTVGTVSGPVIAYWVCTAPTS